MKIKRLLLTAALTAALAVTSAVPAMAETVTADAGDQAVVTTTAVTTKWTSSKLKAATVTAKAASYRYDKVKLTWEQLAGVDGYQVYRATSKTGTYTKVATVKGDRTTSYINTGLTCGKTYYYKVRALKKISGKYVYSKYSAVTSGKPVPSKTRVKDAWGSAIGTHTVYVEWTGIAGATDYEVQYRYTLNGKTSSWKTKVESIDGEWLPFKTYNTLYREAKKKYPSGYVTGVVLAGYPRGSKIPLKEYVESTVKKNQALVSWVPQDDRIYEFRVRAYRTVSGKKVYGAWSDPYTMVETFDIDAAYAELEAYAKDYAAKNYPQWHYIDDHEGMNDSNASFYVEGELGGSSRYVKQEDFIENYKDDIARYIRRMKSSGGQKEGFVYIKKVRPGDTEGLGINDSDNTYYAVWMLY